MERPDPRPTINLTTERVGCSQHSEPFRARWPLGFFEFADQLFDEAEFEDPEPGTPAGAAAIEAALDLVPLCERVSKATLIRIYIASGIGSDGECEVCHQTEIGSPYTSRRPNGKIQRWRHIGFRCVASLQRVN